MTYTKSNFVKAELKKTKWGNREYIERLMDIEKIILGTYCSTGIGYIRNHLKSKYPKQWKAIYLELRPEQYKKNLDYEQKEAERERKEDERLKKEEDLEYKKDKKAWKQLGGRD